MGSVITLKDIPSGTSINKDMIWIKRPGYGIPADQMHNVIGKRTKIDLRANQIIQWNDLE